MKKSEESLHDLWDQQNKRAQIIDFQNEEQGKGGQKVYLKKCD